MTLLNESLRGLLKPVVSYLEDDSVSEILINGPSEVWIEREGRLARTEARFSEEGLLGAAKALAQLVGQVLNDECPRLDARLPDGSQVHAVLSPVARSGTTLSFRKALRERPSLDTLIAAGALSRQMGRLLEAVIQLKLNGVVAGRAGSGRTTLLNAASALIPNDERILLVENTPELQLNQEHRVCLARRTPDRFGKGEVSLSDLVQSAVRLRPDRLLLGEVNGAECLPFLQALNSGHTSALATCHANTPLDALRRLEALCLMNGELELPLLAVRTTVASAISMVVFCERLADGSRKVTHLSEVLPLNERGELRIQDLFVYTPIARDADGPVLGYHAPTGILPSFFERLRSQGFSELDATFFDPATYSVPPPPHGNHAPARAVRWAPSLKHRERGLADPAEWQVQYAELEERLRLSARAARGRLDGRQSAPLSSPAKTPPSMPPLSPSFSGWPAEPTARPTRPALRPPEGSDADKTPPPARPIVRRLSGADLDPSSTHSDLDEEVDEASVQVSDELHEEAMAEGTRVRQYPPAPTPPRRQLRPNLPEDEEEALRREPETGVRPIPQRFRR